MTGTFRMRSFCCNAEVERRQDGNLACSRCLQSLDPSGRVTEFSPEPPVVAHVDVPLRHYAAIALRVPDSGLDWLDKMITERLRDDLAAAALQGLLAWPGGEKTNHEKFSAHTLPPSMVAEISYDYANDLLLEREKWRGQ